MKHDIWMPLYIGDYLASTSRLTTEQHGAYLLLIMDYWREGPPPDNDQILAQITRMSPDAWSIARAHLEQYFEIEGGRWRHKRIDQELDTAMSRQKARKAKAEAAARARWGDKDKAPSNAPSIPEAKPEGMPEQCQSQSQSQSLKKDNNHDRKGARDSAKRCLAALNKLSGKNFRETDGNLKVIGARLKDYTEDEVIQVIRFKCLEWRGGEMDKYLRPETLFRPTKFDAYLNESQSSPAAKAEDPKASALSDAKRALNDVHGEIKSLENLGLPVPEKLLLRKQELLDIIKGEQK